MAMPMTSQLIFLTLLLASATAPAVSGGHLDNKLMEVKKEKLSYFKVYWHDIYTGPNPTVVMVVPPQNKTSANGFGSVAIFDDPLTEGPDPSSKLVGRAQGLYALVSQEEIGVLMAMNFVFLQGKYNGSTITIMGSNRLAKVREMPVIGGTGLFRFARGFVQVSTVSFNPKTGDAVTVYHINALHY